MIYLGVERVDGLILQKDVDDDNARGKVERNEFVAVLSVC